MNSNREKITNIVMVGVFAAVLAVLSQISFPLPSGIPVTLQTFAVALCGYALGCKRGTLAVLVYIVLGAVGLPVFANFSGGFGSLGRSRGRLHLRLPAHGCAVRSRHKNAAPCARRCTRCCGSCGLPSVRHDSVRHDLRQRAPWAAFLVASVPYLVKDIISVAAAYGVATALSFALKKSGIHIAA